METNNYNSDEKGVMEMIKHLWPKLEWIVGPILFAVMIVEIVLLFELISSR